MVRKLDENMMYGIMRYSLISQFAENNFLEKYDLDITHFQAIYEFLKKMYYTYCKVREDAQKL